MLGEYDGYIFMANIQGDQVTLITFDSKKALEGFEPKRDYFKKIVQLDDPVLAELYEIRYWVKYTDSVETKDLWLVDEGRSVGLSAFLENDEIIIDVTHDAKDDSWMQYDKGAAAKKISLCDCTDCFIEKIYKKRKDRIVNDEVDRIQVKSGILKNTMIMNRRGNL